MPATVFDPRGALTLVGVPNPLLRGALAFVANFIPDLGTLRPVGELPGD